MAITLQNSAYAGYRTKTWCVLILGMVFCQTALSKQFIFASKDDCDRHSLDAVYHDKYKTMTEDIFADSLEFASRVLDLVLDSLTAVMADLPGRDTSDQKERTLHMRYNDIKKRFSRSVNKTKANITSAWTQLLSVNQDMLFDLAETDLYEVRNKTGILTDTYKLARSTLDSRMVEVVSTVKAIIKGGLKGIKIAAETQIRKERKAANESSASSSDQMTESTEKEENNEDKIDEEELETKMKNITQDIAPGFLCKATLLVLERKINLERKVDTTPSQRDSVLDDICFDLALIQNKVFTTIAEDLLKNKDTRDLVRRNLYMYWSNLASSMYEKKMQRKATPSVDRVEKYKKIWENEDQVADTLVNLLQVYP